MLMDQQQQQVYKYYCRICKRGFGCGRALGGHMRAHGINDDPNGANADDDPSGSGEWDYKLAPPPGHKRMFALRTNPNRLKSCRVCENCGEEFLSWKSFLEHGKCSSDGEGDVDSLASSDGEGDNNNRGCAGWSKGKRSRWAKAAVAPSSEEEDLANCLVMLSAARVDPVVVVETEESCASAGKEEDQRRHVIDRTTVAAAEKAKAPVSAVPITGKFECKACKKVFSSHQALGGHRASHKKVKGCFAAKLDDMDEPSPDEEVMKYDNNEGTTAENAMAIVPFDNSPVAVKKKSKVHECSICHRVFASGQALGGHKRCHWITSNSPDPAAMVKLHVMPDHAMHHHHQLTLGPMFEPSNSKALDLNFPAPVDELAGVRQDMVGSPLRLEVPAIYLQPWIDQSNTNTNNNNTSSNNNNINSNNNNNETCNVNVDDEADSKIKLAKLSDLKDMTMGGKSSPWLQVGIGSSTNEGDNP